MKSNFSSFGKNVKTTLKRKSLNTGQHVNNQIFIYSYRHPHFLGYLNDLKNNRGSRERGCHILYKSLSTLRQICDIGLHKQNLI